MSSESYRVCVRCVMDTSHREIEFDESGVCNYCNGYEQKVKNRAISADAARSVLERQIASIKHDGRDREYDCVLGVSGGVDSSYLAMKCKDWGIRPLLVQFDNGWNSELANHNIQALCQKLDFDLFTYVVDWPEFRDLQLAFLKAGVANVEAPSDHGIFACVYKTSLGEGIRWVLTGVNSATESNCPIGSKVDRVFSYGYRYGDLYHLKALHRRFGSGKLRTFPTLGYFRRFWLERTQRIRRFDPLNYIPYNKAAAIAELQERVSWRPYPGKHFESVITRFHQAYILPVKFGMDKRRLHLSGLIWSGQLTRPDALVELAQPICDPSLLKQDRDFFIKKMGLTTDDFVRMMAEPPHDYSEYPNANALYLRFESLLRSGKKLKQLKGPKAALQGQRTREARIPSEPVRKA